MSEEALLKARVQSRIGTMLHGKYRVDALLGVGGMGAVFAATHRNKKRFAVKVLHPELSLRDDLRRRFVREGYVVNSLQHPGAVAILDDDVTDDGAAFLVMELLEGATVERVWQTLDKKLPPEAVVALAHPLLDTLAAAHARAIVHRDVKPANLFLQRDGTVKVLDFGIARVRDASAGSVTNTGALLGTPAYMAPEQASGETNGIGGETDVWAVGATMFTLLAGKLVRTGENGQQMIIEAATKPARSLATERPDLPPLLVEIIDKALAFDRHERWTAAAMRDALAGVSESLFGAPITRAPLAALLAQYDERATPSSRALPMGAPAREAEAASEPSLDMEALGRVVSPVARSGYWEASALGRNIGATTAQSVSKPSTPVEKTASRRTGRGSLVLMTLGAALAGATVAATLVHGSGRVTTFVPTEDSVAPVGPKTARTAASEPPAVVFGPPIALRETSEAAPAPEVTSAPARRSRPPEGMARPSAHRPVAKSSVPEAHASATPVASALPPAPPSRPPDPPSDPYSEM
jgi:serine/threonine protein kinase